MTIPIIPTEALAYEVVDTLPKVGKENTIYEVSGDSKSLMPTNYRYHNGEWQTVDLGVQTFGFQFADYQEAVAEAVAELEAVIEEQTVKIAELEEAVFTDKKSTVLYADGTLIINEPSHHRDDNMIELGEIIAEYPPLDARNDYVFSSRTDQPWKNEREKIRKIVFGSLVCPRSMGFWFQACPNLDNIDWHNYDGSMNVSCRATFASTGVTSLTFPAMPNLETIQYICQGCESLTDVSFAGVNATDVSNLTDSFQGCYSLREVHLVGLAGVVDKCDRSFANISGDGKGDMTIERIYSDGKLTFDQASASTSMFRSCVNLVGGNGTTFHANSTNKAYARIDTTEEPGYFTEA